MTFKIFNMSLSTFASLLTISIFRLYRSYYFTLHGDGDAIRYTKLLQGAEYLTLNEYLVFTFGLEPGSVILFYFFRGFTFFELNLFVTGLYILCLLVLLFRIKHNHIVLSFFILTSPVFLGSFFFGGVRQLSALALFLLVICSRKLSIAFIATLLHKSGLVAFMLIRFRSYFGLFVFLFLLMFLILFLEDFVKIFFSGREDAFRAASLNPTSFLVGPLALNLILLGSLPSLSSSQKFLVLLFFGFLFLHPLIPGLASFARFIPYFNILLFLSTWNRFPTYFRKLYAFGIFFLEILFYFLPYNSLVCYYSGVDFCSF